MPLQYALRLVFWGPRPPKIINLRSRLAIEIGHRLSNLVWVQDQNRDHIPSLSRLLLKSEDFYQPQLLRLYTGHDA
jgi:hypothetical protein